VTAAAGDVSGETVTACWLLLPGYILAGCSTVTVRVLQQAVCRDLLVDRTEERDMASPCVLAAAQYKSRAVSGANPVIFREADLLAFTSTENGDVNIAATSARDSGRYAGKAVTYTMLSCAPEIARRSSAVVRALATCVMLQANSETE
jgi:hypothetical protein